MGTPVRLRRPVHCGICCGAVLTILLKDPLQVGAESTDQSSYGLEVRDLSRPVQFIECELPPPYDGGIVLFEGGLWGEVACTEISAV